MTAEARRHHAAVLGHPIAHSLSPVLHRAAYSALGLTWTYGAHDVQAHELEDFLGNLDPSWGGLSLTMPLKEAVLPLLTTRSMRVELSQAANTVVIDGAERHGHNTDIPGVVAALREHGIDKVVEASILGTGATARSSLIAVAELGAEHVTVIGRSSSGHERLQALGEALGIAVSGRTWDDPAVALEAPIVLSTVPAEVAGTLVGDIPSKAGLLFDVLYDPWPTPLAAAWHGRGPLLGGLELLVQQAAAQVELMTGVAPPVGVMKEAGEAALAERARASRRND